MDIICGCSNLPESGESCLNWSILRIGFYPNLGFLDHFLNCRGFIPLDGHSYLLSKGWTGKGTGLRHGAIARPLAIPQKRTLAGLGKDRDEAFPFWDQ